MVKVLWSLTGCLSKCNHTLLYRRVHHFHTHVRRIDYGRTLEAYIPSTDIIVMPSDHGCCVPITSSPQRCILLMNDVLVCILL